MKKILIINTEYARGGAAGVARSVFEYFKNNPEIDVYFAYGRGELTTEPKTFYFGNKFETMIHIALVRFLGLEGFGSHRSTDKLISFIKQHGFTAVHIHNLHGYYLNYHYFLRWLSENNIKVIWTLHDEWLLTWLPAHSMGCAHCQGGTGRCINKYDYPKNYLPVFKSLMLRLKAKLVRYENIKFIAPADWLYDKLKNRGAANAELISNGIDLTIFKPRNKQELRHKYNLPADKKIVLFSAADLKNKNKGIKYILEAMDKLADQKLHFISIGAGDLPASVNLTSFGMVNDKNKRAEICSLADLYCLPSLAETASLSLMESLACGVPAVAFNIPANGYLRENDCGLLAEDISGDALARVITYGLTDDSHYRVMQDSCLRVAKLNFDVNAMLEKYKKLYETL